METSRKLTLKHWLTLIVWHRDYSRHTSGPFCQHGLTLILAWISNYIHYKVWYKLRVHSQTLMVYFPINQESMRWQNKLESVNRCNMHECHITWSLSNFSHCTKILTPIQSRWSSTMVGGMLMGWWWWKSLGQPCSYRILYNEIHANTCSCLVLMQDHERINLLFANIFAD